LPGILVGRIEIEQVLLNLLRNSVDAMEQQPTTQRRIRVRTRQVEDAYVQFTVTDTGPGLSEDQMRRVFEPFYTSKQSGMGIGLSLCRTLASHHEGDLWPEPVPEGGLSMHLRLPVAQPTKDVAA
jgi:signal transduction histidine kinase